MRIAKLILSLLGIAFGIFMVVYGERDDSPGAQLMGVVAALAGIWGLVKSFKKKAA